MKKISILLLLGFITSLATPFPLLAETMNYNYLASDSDMADLYAMDFETLEYFLTRGSLADLETEDVNGVERSAAEIIWNVSQEFELSPQFLLVLLQREQSLVEDDDPSQDQIDWALGYAVCDDCAKDDPQIQKYKGFGNQVYYAAKRIRESYLDDLESRGYTVSGIGPGIEIEIDGMDVVPVNNATSVLYTYTPHLHGNENFYIIWQRWFTHVYPSGTLLQDQDTGGIWYIQSGKRRAITSTTAYYSRFANQPVIPASQTTIEQYPEGDPISFANYSLLRSPGGTVYLIVDDARRGIASSEAFRAIGFNPDEIIDVEWSDLDPYTEGEPITIDSADVTGTLLQNSSTGGVYYVEEGVKHPIVSRELLDVNFLNWPILPKTPEELEDFETGEEVMFPDGSLVIAEDSPDVFVISDGERRHIPDEETFLTYGWDWSDLIFTTEKSVLLHRLGDAIESIDEGETNIEAAVN